MKYVLGYGDKRKIFLHLIALKMPLTVRCTIILCTTKKGEKKHLWTKLWYNVKFILILELLKCESECAS